MYYPKSKYSSPKYTAGNELEYGGKPYKGWYVITYKDEYLSGKLPSRDSKTLSLINKKQKVRTPKIYSEKVEPNSGDYTNGTWRRYLLQDKRSKKIVEVSKQKFDSYKNVSYIVNEYIDWILKGPSGNVVVKKYTYYGAAHRNKEAALKLEEKMPGVSEFFKDYSKFVD